MEGVFHPLDLGFALYALDFIKGIANASAADFNDFDSTIAAKPPKKHARNFPALPEFGGGEE